MRQAILNAIAALAIVAFATPPSIAVENGTFDGNNHPAVGSMLASIGPDFCSLSHQFDAECSAFLIASDLLLTAAECATELKNAVAAGSVDRVWVDFNPDGTLNCADFVAVDANQIFENPSFDPAHEDAANAAVLRLAASSSVTPVSLPAANAIASLPTSQAYTAVAYGGIHSVFNPLQARLCPASGPNPRKVQGGPRTITRLSPSTGQGGRVR